MKLSRVIRRAKPREISKPARNGAVRPFHHLSVAAVVVAEAAVAAAVVVTKDRTRKETVYWVAAVVQVVAQPVQTREARPQATARPGLETRMVVVVVDLVVVLLKVLAVRDRGAEDQDRGRAPQAHLRAGVEFQEAQVPSQAADQAVRPREMVAGLQARATGLL